MKQRFRILQRAGGVFYLHDNQTGKRKSLETTVRIVAQRLLHAQNAAHEQPILNLQLARTYLSATNPEMVKRTWLQVFDEIIKTKRDNTADRWIRAASDTSFDVIKSLPLFETQSHHFLKVLELGTVSTNVYLRRVHNFALDMSWLLAPVLPKKQWPPRWTYAPQKNIPHRENPNLADGEMLSEAVKEYDRIAVRAIPTLLASVGKKICPKGTSGGVPSSTAFCRASACCPSFRNIPPATPASAAMRSPSPSA